MRTKSLWIRGTLLLAGLALGNGATPLQAQGHVAIAAGLYQPGDSDQDRTEVFGLRGGYRLRPNFGLEVNLSRVDLADTLQLPPHPSIPGFGSDLQVDLYNLDLSLQWFPRGGHFLIFGGTGGSRLDVEIRSVFFGETFTETFNSYIFTAHAGLAYDWRLGDHLFLRPEARARRYFDNGQVEFVGTTYKATDYEANLAFGWRFGG